MHTMSIWYRATFFKISYHLQWLFDKQRTRLGWFYIHTYKYKIKVPERNKNKKCTEITGYQNFPQMPLFGHYKLVS